MIELTNNPIDISRACRAVQSPQAGAVLLFLGTVREFTHGRQTEHLNYECYRDMALAKLEELTQQARAKWDLVSCFVAHRLGRLDLGEISIAVAVSSPHREVAFTAGKWLIDTIKQVVPIWKEEHWSDGSTQWVHPGTNQVTCGPREIQADIACSAEERPIGSDAS